MELIKLSRELGKAIQNNELYKRMHEVKQKVDNDANIQNLIGDFNLKKIAINNEMNNTEHDEEKVKKLNEEMRNAYTNIMEHPDMIEYNKTQNEMNELLQRINAIIVQSAQGEDPETTDFVQSSCGGSCGSCGGCH